jgi:Tfp pilus assembly protein PilW
MSANRRTQAGFTLLEALIATLVLVTVTAAVFAVLDPSHGILRTQPEVADMQQRLRVGVDTLRHDLVMVGAGAYEGAQSGSLVGHFAPIMPFRQGASPAYDDGVGVFRSNAVTIVYVPSTPSQTTIRTQMTDASSVAVNWDSGCPAADPLCGFEPGRNVVVYDSAGAFDTFYVAGTDPAGTLTLQHMQQGALSKTYPPGSKIAEVVQHSYYIDATNMQLMRYDGLSTATAVLDNVVALDFEYYGEPEPPAFRNPGVDQSVTYGPAPPALDVTQSPYAAGENCTWQTSGGDHVTRLASLGPMGNTGLGLVRLTAAQLTDGPWCPDASSPNRYDADLLRIRRVRVTIRLQTGNAALRGSLTTGNDALFANAGTANNGAHTVSDQSIRFDVSPRNMNLGR